MSHRLPPSRACGPAASDAFRSRESVASLTHSETPARTKPSWPQ
jgi:hypothetical protein